MPQLSPLQKQLILLLPILGVFKRILKFKTYSQVFILAFGGFEAIRSRLKLFPAMYLLIFMVLLNFIPLVSEALPYTMGFRLLQLLLMIYFLQFVAREYSPKTFEYGGYLILTLHLIQVLAESIGPPSGFLRRIWGINIPRFSGVIGEPNFSAALLLGFAGILYFQKNKRLAVLMSLGILPTLSRAGFICMVFLFFSWTLAKYSKKLGSIFSYTVLVLGILAPIFAYIANKNADSNQLKALIEKSQRIYLVPGHIDIGLDHPVLGVGYRNSINYINTKTEYVKSLSRKPPLKSEQHSLYVQVFSEFGFVGLILFLSFVFYIHYLALLRDPLLSSTWSILLFCFVFMNGLSELVIYLVAGYILNQSSVFQSWCNQRNLSTQRAFEHDAQV